MNKNNINFNDRKTKKTEFYKNKKIFKNHSFIYFIGYNDNDVIRPVCLKFSKMTGYVNKFDENKITMSLLGKDKTTFKKLQ